MKTLLPLSLSLAISLCANELSWVDEQVAAIKPPRSGVSMRSIKSIRDPFIFLEKNKKATKKTKQSNTKTSTSNSKQNIVLKKSVKKAQPMRLQAVINHSALIDGKWYKLNDKIKDFRIVEIHPRSVLLMKKNKKVLLSTSSKNENLKFK